MFIGSCWYLLRWFNVLDLTLHFVQLHSFRIFATFRPLYGGVYLHFHGSTTGHQGRNVFHFDLSPQTSLPSPINKTHFPNPSKISYSEFSPSTFEFLVICGKSSGDSSALRRYNFSAGTNFGSSEHFERYYLPDRGKFAVDRQTSHIRKSHPSTEE